jgi:hypothetical protein
MRSLSTPLLIYIAFGTLWVEEESNQQYNDFLHDSILLFGTFLVLRRTFNHRLHNLADVNLEVHLHRHNLRSTSTERRSRKPSMRLLTLSGRNAPISMSFPMETGACLLPSPYYRMSSRRAREPSSCTVLQTSCSFLTGMAVLTPHFIYVLRHDSMT